MAAAGKGAGKGAAKGAGKGAAKGKGGGGGGLGGGIAGMVKQQMVAAEAPIHQQIQAERAANLAKAQSQMGFAKAAAAIMQQAAPAVSTNYTNAANADAGYARGLGNVAQAPIDANTAANNAFLTSMGAPAGALKQAAPVGNIAYGLQGYIPASTLQREGAAYGSAAQLFPGDLLKGGQQQAGCHVDERSAISASLQTDLSKVAATEPEVYQTAVTAAQEEAYKRQALAISAFRANTSAQQGQERIGIAQQNSNISAQRLQLEAQKAASSNKLAWTRIGIEDKRLQIEVAKQDISARAGGLTPAGTVKIQVYCPVVGAEDSGSVYSTRTTEVKDAGGQYVPKQLPQLSVKDAVSEALKAGVPLSIAVNQTLATLKGHISPAEANQIRKEYGGLDKSIAASVRRLGPANRAPGFPQGAGVLNQTGNTGQLAAALRRYPNLDSNAVFAIASMEGLGGGVGDHGTSFGPFQLHAGGALPASVWAKGAAYAQQWAWSPAGLDYALSRINSIAGGLRGPAAISAISRRFERPANPAAEIAGAESHYGR